MADLHPQLAAVASLVGTWSGQGHGDYPTIDAFDYAETVSFAHVGKPFLAYAQRTRAVLPDGSFGSALHAETGYWRFPAPGRVEVVLSHPTGIAEVEEGTIELFDGVIVVELASTHVTRPSSAKLVTGIERTFRFDAIELTYEVRMAAVGLPLQHHLAARLVRDEETAQPPA
jgi:hypothetical protein